MYVNATWTVWILAFFKMITGTILAEWSAWGIYGDCSRPCGGGLVNRTRTCIGASHTCQGTDVHYKVCNTHACTDGSHSLRELQCMSYDNVSIKGNFYHWVPEYNPSKPCALYCRTIETGFVLSMEQHVANGTSCELRGLGVCIAGVCKSVGCDGMVGSQRRLDYCGVCGGHNACLQTVNVSDNESAHQWDVRWDRCSQSCGNGVQTASIVCQKNGIVVEDILCSNQIRPESALTRECVATDCLYRWHTFKWGSCSRTCGNGQMYRRVVCLKDRHQGQQKPVSDSKCTGVQPISKAVCNFGDCPEWLTGPWSHCSVSCGYGEQKRKVVCRAASVASCSTSNKPEVQQKCFAGKSCNNVVADRFQQDDSSMNEQDMYDNEKLQELFIIPQFQVSDWGPCSATCGIGYVHRNVTCMKGGHAIPLSECQGIEPYGKRNCHNAPCLSTDMSDAKYIWLNRQFEPCSQTCGRGLQKSILECADASNNHTVQDDLCQNLTKPKPVTQNCNTIKCPPNWKVGEYGVCSLPCGNGRQSREVECVQITSYGGIQTLPTYRCPDPIPLSERYCNTQFCQAQWKTGVWGECSVTCGVGTETRSVYCVIQVKTNIEVNVSNSECLEPRPQSTRPCHFGSCYNIQQLPHIQEQKGTFIQIKRSKRIQLLVGETAVLLPHQAVKITCPVKNFQKQLIFWTKKHRLVPLVGRVRVSSNGALRILRADPKTDAGVFTCSVGTLHASVNITFQSKAEARHKAVNILNTIFHNNFNESLINRPQADGIWKMKNATYFHINAIDDPNFVYDYSSFSMTNWTACSVKCGWGTQERLVTCNHITDKFIRLLPEEECIKKGLNKPASSRKCSDQPACPQWIASEWEHCSKENCQTQGLSMQARTVKCGYENKTSSAEELCNEIARPVDKRLCKYGECTPVWQTSTWSQCLPECGIKGQMVRTLSCVWSSTQKSAYDNCKELPRPAVAKTCTPSPCNTDTCLDTSSYCDLAGHLKMCRFQSFKANCCKTCSRFNLL